LIEAWRRWKYRRLSEKLGASDDFKQFEEWASGPWTPALARKIPMAELLAGPPMGSIDAQTRKVIDLEVARRSQSISPIIANVISALALIVVIMAFYHDSSCD
jgi:hypothetical protein